MLHFWPNFISPGQKIDFPNCIPAKQKEMKLDWKNFISFVSFQRSLISFGNVSNQTYWFPSLYSNQTKWNEVWLEEFHINCYLLNEFQKALNSFGNVFKLISHIVFQLNKLKWSLIGIISFHLLAYKSFQRLLISFENASNQTYERKYLQNFQSKLMISVNFSNQTSFQLFHWNVIRKTKFEWKFFHSKFIWLVWLEEFTDIFW